MLAAVTGFLALLLTAVALPPLLARLTGGHAPRPGPQLAALAPVATLPALAAVALAAASAWWLAALLGIPAAILLAWQLPPFPSNANARPVGPGGGAADGRAASVRSASPGRLAASPPDTVTVRVLTLNSRGGSADPAAVLAVLRQHAVDVLAVQELTSLLQTRNYTGSSLRSE